MIFLTGTMGILIWAARCHISSLSLYIFFRLKEIKHTRARYDKRVIVEATATRKSIDLTL